MNNLDLKFVDIPKINNDIMLEDLCNDLLDNNQEYDNVNLHGRPGQKQDGVDVFARNISTGNWDGYQCKVRSTNKSFSKKELQTEVDMALCFNPLLKNYYLYTTLSRDKVTQEFVREINDELFKNRCFSFEVKFWEDIMEILKDPKSIITYSKFYRKFFRDNTSFGHAIGKLINLVLGEGSKLDTKYEILLGKIPKYKNKASTNVDYYRGTYFISDLNQKTFDTFTIKEDSTPFPLYHCSIERAVSNNYDRFRIGKWITSIEKDIDNVIYNDKSRYEFFLSDEDKKDFISSLQSEIDD